MTQQSDHLLAEAMRELEASVSLAKDKANALDVLCDLTLGNLGHELSEAETSALVHLIGETFIAVRDLSQEWERRWEEAVSAGVEERSAA